MIKSTRNQIGNAKNPYQTEAKRVLCCCSAGLLRSPTLANVLHKEYGYNTRACGTEKEFALIPITEVLIRWAEEIVFVNKSSFDALGDEELNLVGRKAVVLDVPDEYDWNDPLLQSILLHQYNKQEDKSFE